MNLHSKFKKETGEQWVVKHDISTGNIVYNPAYVYWLEKEYDAIQNAIERYLNNSSTNYY